MSDNELIFLVELVKNSTKILTGKIFFNIIQKQSKEKRKKE